jgi:hypothetical protein
MDGADKDSDDDNLPPLKSKQDFLAERMEEEANDSMSEKADDYGSESGSEADKHGEEEKNQSSDEDREYIDDMFKDVEPVHFASSEKKAIGVLNEDLNVKEYICLSIWRNGGANLRYSRLKNSIIPIPPVKTDRRFHTSHSASSIYYLGREIVVTGEAGKLKVKPLLVVVSLKDLKFKQYELEKCRQIWEAERLYNLTNSSLVCGDSKLCFTNEKEEKRNFYVLNLRDFKIEFTYTDCERVFFTGQYVPEDKAPDFED